MNESNDTINHHGNQTQNAHIKFLSHKKHCGKFKNKIKQVLILRSLHPNWRRGAYSLEVLNGNVKSVTGYCVINGQLNGPHGESSLVHQ